MPAIFEAECTASVTINDSALSQLRPLGRVRPEHITFDLLKDRCEFIRGRTYRITIEDITDASHSLTEG